MEISTALGAIRALSHEARLKVFRLLVKSGQQGLAAGAIAEELAIPKPTLSFHLKELTGAGLIGAHRSGRCIFYKLDPSSVRELWGFLATDCCDGNPELCFPDLTADPEKKCATC